MAVYRNVVLGIPDGLLHVKAEGEGLEAYTILKMLELKNPIYNLPCDIQMHIAGWVRLATFYDIMEREIKHIQVIFQLKDLSAAWIETSEDNEDHEGNEDSFVQFLNTWMGLYPGGSFIWISV